MSMRRHFRSEKERNLWRYKPENRLIAIKRYYDARARLTVRGQEALALLLEANERLPYSALSAQEPMVVVYGRPSDHDSPCSILGHLTLAKLEQLPRDKGTRLQAINGSGSTQLSVAQLDRLRGLALGLIPQIGARTRTSALAERQDA